MTRKDFQLIADAIKNTRLNEIQMGAQDEHLVLIDITLSSVAQQLANLLKETNPRFDTNRFLDACEVKF